MADSITPNVETEATIERKIMRGIYQLTRDIQFNSSNKLFAIKAFRSVTGKNLIDSKQLYEAVERTYQTEDWLGLLKARGIPLWTSVAGAIYIGPDEVALGTLETPLPELKSQLRQSLEL